MVTSLIRVTQVQPLARYRLNVSFCDGRQGVFDMAPWLGKEDVFTPLTDTSVFNTARTDGQTVVWADGSIDLAPETIYAHTVFR